MATININGRRVKVDDSFLSLSPEQQNATVDEIAASFTTPGNVANPSQGFTDAMAGQSQRSSSVPRCCPAELNGWHGKPAVMRSTRPRHGRASNVVRSSQTGAGSRRACAIRSTRTAAA